MRLELISYLVCAFLSHNISAEGRNPCFCPFLSIKTELCSEDQTCCMNKFGEMGCCPYKNGICCPGGQCCPVGMECNMDKMRCDYESVNETTHTFMMGSSDQVTNLRILFSPIFDRSTCSKRSYKYLFVVFVVCVPFTKILQYFVIY